MKLLQSCPTLSNPIDCSLPGSSVHGIFQAILEWVAISFSRGSSQPRGWTWVSSIVGRLLPSETPGKYQLLKKKKKRKSGFKAIFIKTSLKNTGSLLKPFPKPNPRDPRGPDSSQDYGQPIQDNAAPSKTSRKKKPNICRAWERAVPRPALSRSTSALQSMVGVCRSQICFTYLVSHHPCGAS